MKCKSCNGSGEGEYNSSGDCGYYSDCKRCNGSGQEPDICYDCGGSGKIVYVTNAYQDFKINLEFQGYSKSEISKKASEIFGIKCDNCNGSGKGTKSSWW